MRPDENPSQHPLDESIRIAFEPSPGQVRQLTNAALSEDRASTRSQTSFLVAFASVVVACLFVASVLLLPGPPPGSADHKTHHSGTVISNTHGVLTAETAAGQIIVIVSGGAS